MESSSKATSPGRTSPARAVLRIRPTSWLSVILLASVVLGAWVWSERVARSEDALIRELSASGAIAVSAVVEAEVASLATSLSRFAGLRPVSSVAGASSRWGAAASPALEWVRSSTEFRTLAGFRAVGWFPDGDGARLHSGEWSEDEAAAAATGFAVSFPSEVRTDRVRVFSSQEALWFGVRLGDDADSGVLLAVIDASTLAARVPALTDSFGMMLESPAGTTYTLGTLHPATAVPWAAELPLRIGGEQWQVRAVPSEREVVRLKSSLPTMILVVGILFGSLCSVVIRALQMERTSAGRARLATTQLRASEAEVRALNAGLEQRVADRTAALERSNRDLEQFAYAASHDLQEPLRMVVSYLQLLERRYSDVLDDKGREFLNFAVDGGVRMRELVRGLLHYARVGRGRVEAVEVRLDDVLSDVLSNLSVAIAERDAEVVVSPLPVVGGDYELLVQLFQNLVGNSLKYATERPRVRVSGEQVAGDDGFSYRIQVEDSGIGIPADAADRIFELFQRLHDRETYEGTGLGLAVCKRIAELHSGEIHLDTSYTDGCRFVLVLPRLAVHGRKASRSALFRLAQSE